MYELAVRVKVHCHKGEEFLQTLRSLQKEEASASGAANFRLFKDGVDRSAYRLHHTWETEEELVRYLSGDKFRILLGALQVLCEEFIIQYTRIPEYLIHHLGPMLGPTACGPASLPSGVPAINHGFTN